MKRYAAPGPSAAFRQTESPDVEAPMRATATEQCRLGATMRHAFAVANAAELRTGNVDGR